MQHNALLRWYASKLDSHPLKTKIITSGFLAGSGDLLCQSFGLGTTTQNKPHFENDDDGNDRYSRNDSSNDDDDSNNHHRQYYDVTRTAKFAFLGASLVAPATHVWYGYLMTKIPGSSPSVVAKRLACDQGLFAPVFLTTFISCLTVLDHITTILIANNNCQIDQTAHPNAHHLHDDRNNNQHFPNAERRATSFADSSSFSSSTSSTMSPPLHTLLLTRIQNDVPQSLVVGWSIWIPSMAYMFAYIPGKYQVLFSNTVGFVWNVYLSWRMHHHRPSPSPPPPPQPPS
jgi:hypothetical protein